MDEKINQSNADGIGNKKSDENVDNENVKSAAVVKYSVPKPARYLQLQCNTDLNVPPSNWLSNSFDLYGLQHVLYQPKGFTSFRMAHTFPNCIGEVDVISDSENIKKLLKIPYEKGLVSMLVHRIENTLLLDWFDMYKCCSLYNRETSEWQWFNGLKNHGLVDKAIFKEEKAIYINNKKHKALKEKGLESKFFYYSLGQNENEVISDENNRITYDVVEGPVLPEPSPSEEVPDPTSFNQPYNRNVVWSFENIEMLIGTDMPIFGGGTHPCISLRLNDMNKPINVLTGIDYWLDNLMSNVPEVVMCYHLNGIVQKYELIKTEDLPSMDNSKFSPKLIRDVAQSILSFLKSNATKAGHTYWLFKGKDEEVIKLYDLTCLCSGEMLNNDQNPFTVPVAMLLYKVAKNMNNSADRKPGTIRKLLKNCIKLLSEEKYPEIVTSSHYILSDLYIPLNTNPEHPVFDDLSEDTDDILYDDDEEDLDGDDKNGASSTKSLNLKVNLKEANVNFNDYYYKHPPPISGLLEERCFQCIIHVAMGLDCIQYFGNGEFKVKDENVPFAKPNEPIPMPYGKLNETKDEKKTKKSKKKNKGKGGQSLSDQSLLPKLVIQETVRLWDQHLKTLLYEKAILVYAVLVERNYTLKRYGDSLRCLGILIRCLQILIELNSPSSTLKENCILGRAGDCCIMILQNWEMVDEYNKQLHSTPDEDLKILKQIERDERINNVHLIDVPMRCVLIYELRTKEQMLVVAIECYESALKYSQTDDMQRRLANALNELGTFFLHKSKTLKEDRRTALEVCEKAKNYIHRGIDIFKKIKDEVNEALLYTNLGHLSRTLAHIVMPVTEPVSDEGKFHYNKAFDYYKKALQVLGERTKEPAIWDVVHWELSSALYNMACFLHDMPSMKKYRTENEKEILEAYQKALQYCDLDPENVKYPLYVYRAAEIYFKIANIYHSNLKSYSATTKTMNHQLAKINYEKSTKYFLMSADFESYVKYLRSQMMLVCLLETAAEDTKHSAQKCANYIKSLKAITEVQQFLKLVVEKKVEIPEDEIKEFTVKVSDYNSLYSLVLLAKKRLQYILLQLVKLCSKNDVGKERDNAGVYKKFYAESLEMEKCSNFYELLAKLHDLIVKIANNV